MSHSSDIKILPRAVRSQYTGSPFDSTDILSIKVGQAGRHAGILVAGLSRPGPWTVNNCAHIRDGLCDSTPQERPGAHNLPSRAIDVSAFSLAKRTGPTDPHHFLKKGTGLGGTLVSTDPEWH